METELSFVIIKPDAVQRGLIGDIISRFEKKGLKLRGLKLLTISQEQADRQYACHKGKPFLPMLLRFMTSGPAVAMVLEGTEAIAIVRKMVGETNPINALPGSIRGDYALDFTQNIVHASDSTQSVQTEMPIFFSESELVKFDLALKSWINFQ